MQPTTDSTVDEYEKKWNFHFHSHKKYEATPLFVVLNIIYLFAFPEVLVCDIIIIHFDATSQKSSYNSMT